MIYIHYHLLFVYAISNIKMYSKDKQINTEDFAETLKEFQKINCIFHTQHNSDNDDK